MFITDKEALKAFADSKRIWQGIPSIEVTRGNRTFVAFYSGGVKEEIGNYVLLYRSDDGIHFGEPIAVCYEEHYRCFDPALWIDPLGRLWLTWSICPNDGLYGVICDNPDGEEIRFGDVFFIGHNVMMNKPIVLSTGEWAFPIAVWNDGVRTLSAEYDSVIFPKGSFLYATADQGKTFEKRGYADVMDRAFDEHMFLELNDKCIRCFVRTKRGIGAADSYDGGYHWGQSFNTGYGGPSSRFFIRRLPSGRVLLINHYQNTGRNNLTAMLSEDNGKTFPYTLLLDERRQVSYPDAAIAADGSIHIVYDRERGAFLHSMKDAQNCAREILLARITEEDIINGSLVDKGSYLKRICNKLTEYDGDEDLYDKKKKIFPHDTFAKGIHQSEDIAVILSRIFDAYNINCMNLHQLDAAVLDELVTTYKAHRSFSNLMQIITCVRSASTGEKDNSQSIVDEICTHILEHLDSNEEIGDIAKQLHYSCYYIQHIFKKHTGMNILAYRLMQRLIKAKTLLKESRRKITEIAGICGFENSSYFAKVFKREIGLSPFAYRQKYQNP